MSKARLVSFLSALVLIAVAAAGWVFLRGGGATPIDAGYGDAAGARKETGVAATLAAAATTKGENPAAPHAARTVVPSAAPSANGYRLTGRLITAENAPIADVEVGLDKIEEGDVLARRIDRGALPARPAPAITARTGADGRFELRGVSEETRLRLLGTTWFLRTTATGASAPAGLDAARAGVEALPIAASTADRDLGDIVIGRRVKVAGVVQNEAGKPVAGVQVRVGGAEAALLPEGFGERGVTDATGRFERAGLIPGKYTVSTASPDFLPASLKIQLREGEDRNDVVVALRAGHIVAGTVVDDNGTPLAGMKVAADRARELAPGVQVQSSSAGEAATTDAAGKFILRGLETATVNVEAWGPGHARGSVAAVAAGTTNVVVRLDRWGSVAGRVVDAAGKPVAGSRVVAQATERLVPVLLDLENGTRTDAQGAFVLDEVRPGTTRIVADGDDHLRVTSAPIDVRPGQRTDGVELVAQRGASLVVKVTDTAGKAIAGVKVSVTSPPNETRSEGLGGGVRRSMRVRRDRAGGSDVMLGDDVEHGSATTDQDGLARIGGLPAGAVVARATHERYAPAASATLAIPSTGETRTDLTVVAGGFVQLQALDAARTALPNAHYKLYGPLGGDAEPPSRSGTCDAKGLATIGPLAPGKFRIRLTLPARPMELGEGMSFAVFGDGGHEFAETEARVEVVAEQTAPVTLTQPQLTTLQGTVSDTKGAVRNAKVRLSESGDLGPLSGGYQATTDALGAFAIKDLPAGKYTLRYGYADAVAMSEEPLEIVAGQVLVERALSLRTGTIKLIVRGENGEPVARARVTLDRRDRSAPANAPRREMRIMAVMRGDDSGGGSQTTSITAGNPSATTDAAGEVEITRVPEGSYTLRVEHPQHVSASKPDVKVQDGATVDLGAITLAAGGELRGRVLDGEGKPVEFANVELTPLPTGERRVEVAINGGFRITGLAAGKYRVRGEIPGGPPGSGVESRSSAPMEVELTKGERKPLELQVR